MIVFPDTNIFLQCRDLEELPWNDISNKENIVIVIAQAVVDEIDNNKTSDNPRKRRRARKANTLFNKIIDAEDERIVIRERDPMVEVVLADPLADFPEIEKGLHLSKPDHRIIYEALAYRKINKNVRIKILTHDTGMKIVARRVNIDYYKLTDEWLLPPEPNERDKEIKKLKEELNSLKSLYPGINVKVLDETGAKINSLTIKVMTYDELSSEVMDELVKEARKRSPMITDFDTIAKQQGLLGKIDAAWRATERMAGFETVYHRPSESEIQDYQQKYGEWLGRVREYFKNLPRVLRLETSYYSVQ